MLPALTETGSNTTRHATSVQTRVCLPDSEQRLTLKHRQSRPIVKTSWRQPRMWKTEKNNQPFVPPQPDRGNNNHEDIQVADRDWPDSPARSSSATLDDLRTQPGFGVVVSSADIQPATPTPTPPNSIGNRMSAELDILSRRDRHVREMKDLATHRVVDLTTEQLRSILEFMA